MTGVPFRSTAVAAHQMSNLLAADLPCQDVRPGIVLDDGSGSRDDVLEAVIHIVVVSDNDGMPGIRLGCTGLVSD